MKYIKYKSGYKYQLDETYKIKIDIIPKKYVGMRFIILDLDGTLIIKAGYAWDGPSGPTFDTKSFMRGSLVHDALYQLMRNNKISLMERQKADQILRDICIEDGMWSFRAAYVYKAVRFFGGAKSRCQTPIPTLIAP